MTLNDLKLSENQLNIIGHSIGINLYHARLSYNPKDKVLPSEFYRNYYCVGTPQGFNDDMKYLESIGFIEKSMHHNQLYFHITTTGINYFKEMFTNEVTNTYVPLSKSKNTYREFLHDDGYGNFSDYLNIDLPKQERSKEGIRLVSTKYNTVKGEYCKTIKEAKISYKTALKTFKNKA